MEEGRALALALAFVSLPLPLHRANLRRVWTALGDTVLFMETEEFLEGRKELRLFALDLLGPAMGLEIEVPLKLEEEEEDLESLEVPTRRHESKGIRVRGRRKEDGGGGGLLLSISDAGDVRCHMDFYERRIFLVGIGRKCSITPKMSAENFDTV